MASDKYTHLSLTSEPSYRNNECLSMCSKNIVDKIHLFDFVVVLLKKLLELIAKNHQVVVVSKSLHSSHLIPGYVA